MAAKDDYKEIRELLERLDGGKPDHTIIVYIPSHDKEKPPKEVPDQEQWADAAMKMFSESYGGCTAFRHLNGMYFDAATKRCLPDGHPIMVQTLTKKENVEDEDKLIRLAKFCRRMGKKTNQASVGLVFDDVFIYIEDYSGA